MCARPFAALGLSLLATVWLAGGCGPTASPPVEPTTDRTTVAEPDPVEPAEPQAPRTRPSARGNDPADLRADGLLMDGDPGPWLPSREQLARARRTLDGDDEQLALRLDALPAPRRIELLRTGLRLPDDLALRAAARLGHAHVDHWESARAVALLGPEVLRPGTAADFEEFRGMLGGAELDAFYAQLPTGEWDLDEGALNQLHRSQTGHHVEVLARLAHAPRKRLAEEAVDELGLLVRYTDRGREAIARALLGAEEAAALPVAGDGLPPLLIASLRVLLTEEFLPRFPDIDLSMEGFHHWALRWLGEAIPADRDALVLVELYEAAGESTGDEALDSFRAYAREQLVLSMAHVGDRASLAILDALRNREGQVSRLASFSLARRGDERAKRELLRSADDDATSFALLLEGFPDDALALAREALRAKDAAVSARFLGRTLLDAREERRVRGLRWTGRPLDRLARDLVRPGIAAHAIPMAAHAIPACRTPAAARAWLDAVPAEQRLAELRRLADRIARNPGDADGAELLDFVAWLETTQPEELRRTLHLATRGDDADLAWELLLRLGDAAHAEQLVGWFGSRAGQGVSPRLLARTRTPAVLGYLQAQLPRADEEDVGDWMVALAMAQGIPERAADTLFGPDAQQADEVPDAAVELLLAGDRAADAVAAVVALYPDTPLWGIGAVRDPRVTDYLRRLQRERHLGLYAWATAQLAIQGDDDAWEETHAVFRTGRYRWIDDLGTQEYTRGGDLALVPEWIDQQESNCCRVATTDEVFEELFGGGRARWPWGESGNGETFVRSYRHWWEDCAGEFAWSRSLDRYVPVRR